MTEGATGVSGARSECGGREGTGGGGGSGASTRGSREDGGGAIGLEDTSASASDAPQNLQNCAAESHTPRQRVQTRTVLVGEIAKPTPSTGTGAMGWSAAFGVCEGSRRDSGGGLAAAVSSLCGRADGGAAGPSEERS